MSGEGSTGRQENERQYRVIDQMLTMHSSHRDRMERKAFWLNTGLIATSLFLAAFAFVGDDLLRSLGADPPLARFLFGIVAVVALIFSITEFRVDWRSVASRSAEAVRELSALKASYRRAFVENEGGHLERNATLTAEYDRIMRNLPVIPERWFNRLRAEHRFKQVLSERVSQCPTAPIWFLRLQLRIEGIREARRIGNERNEES